MIFGHKSCNSAGVIDFKSTGMKKKHHLGTILSSQSSPKGYQGMKKRSLTQRVKDGVRHRNLPTFFLKFRDRKK